MDRDRLVRRLRGIVGEPYVLTDPADVVVYEHDALPLTGHLPDAVVLPGSTAEVADVVRAASECGVPVIPRGAGTGLAGGAVPEGGGVVVALTRMNRILSLDPRHRLAEVEAGVVNADLNAAARPYGLAFAPDPGSQTASTIGGNIATNAGGAHCLAYGVTTHHVLAAEVVLADGRVVWAGSAAADAPGYDLRGLLAGSEGTLGIVTRAVVRLVRLPEGVRTLLAVFGGVESASQAVSDIIASGIVPAALEMLDALTLRIVEEFAHAGYPTDAGAVLLVEVDGLADVLDRLADQVRSLCLRHGARQVRTAASEEERALLWKGRKEAFGALGRVRRGVYLADVTVPRHRLPEMMRRVGEIAARTGVPIANFFHAGDGNLHPNLLYDPRDPRAAAAVARAAEEIIRAGLELGGTITGEHGVGLDKRAHMRWMYAAPDLEAMRRVRRAWDPRGLLNPGKVVPE
ncbi:MAG: FAD-linked oxidase C-terminal domain-containing protein [Armatimonadota bacterium]|nr:FAD-linked oxidase C-terminal domain-containing protein [Armatimonadota bacterium]